MSEAVEELAPRNVEGIPALSLAPDRVRDFSPYHPQDREGHEFTRAALAPNEDPGFSR